MKYKLTRKDPNFTILVPGGCNAKCDFCFWNHIDGKIKPPIEYFANLRNILLSIDPHFKNISVSGGEPSLSKHLIVILETIESVRRERFYDKVVLTTNGTYIERILNICQGGMIDHLNISRHHHNDKRNREIFQTNHVPDIENLAKLIENIHAKSTVDVTINCVHEKDVSVKFIENFISFAQGIRADAVSFRKVASTVKPTKTEEYFVDKYGYTAKNGCTVCRGLNQEINGFEVRWKGSVEEPSIDLDGIYEAVFHPDGNLYADWSRKYPIYENLVNKVDRPEEDKEKKTISLPQRSNQEIYSSRSVGCRTRTNAC